MQLKMQTLKLRYLIVQHLNIDEIIEMQKSPLQFCVLT
jgi:hypothetical protein